MGQASPAEEPSMEEILSSIRRIISDEEKPEEAEGGTDQAEASASTDSEAADDMGDSAELSQDDLDKLFDMDGDDGGDDAAVEEISVEEDEVSADIDMEAAMESAEADEVEDDGVLELTEDLALSEDDVAAEDEIGFAEVEEEVVPEPKPEPAPAPKPVAAAPKAKASVETQPVSLDDLPDVGDEDPLTSDQTGEVVHSAFDNLASLYLNSGSNTVEDLIKDMLRPMLKSWLDQNLPVIVEELVQKEIDRVARRR